MKRLALVCLLPAVLPAQAQTPAHELPYAKERIEWNKPQAPFHVIGNIYYVGMAGVSTFLIVTPKGDILTDGGLPESTEAIEKNIQALGFKLSDIKILLNSHAHFDHSGALAKLKADTGATFYASAGDKPFLESGHITYGLSSQIDTTPVKVDHVVADGDTVSLGGVTLTAHLTPGHTTGDTSWTMPLVEGGVSHQVMFFGSLTVAAPLVGNTAYPQIASDYRASFAKLKTIQADIFLAPHGDQFELKDKLAKLKPGAPNPFIDADSKDRTLEKMEKSFERQLAKDEAAAKAGAP
ncbi:MAG TPA: subclass B3 metallo-beta-lactamase [Rhizomicrobium sp.]|nr:subclass B3 metallo-beta-lactamase [Rhizomicrobium sp.]